MDAGFSHHAVGHGQPRKYVLQSPEYQRRARNVSQSGQWLWQPCGRLMNSIKEVRQGIAI